MAVGYRWLPGMVPVSSKDADLQGYCMGVSGVSGFSVRNASTPLSPEGQFYCNDSSAPIRMDQACRWKWGHSANLPHWLTSATPTPGAATRGSRDSSSFNVG